MKKTILSTYLIIVCLFFMTTSVSSANMYTWSVSQETSNNIEETTAVSSVIADGDETGNTLNLQSGSAILIEQTSGQVLYGYNVHEQLRPASVTKLMSILLIMEQIELGKLDYTTKISCSQTAASMGGSQIWLDTSETLSVDEMLKAICVVSANDCVMAMAEHIAGTEEGFVQLMNAKAQELGMKDTTFKNCHGLDEEGHVTSSYDIALMSRELLKNYPEITKYTTIYMDSLRDGKSGLVNTNKLVRTYTGCTGLKTGSTSQALFNLSASATRDDLSLIAVIMKGPTSAIRFGEAKTLLDYGFNNFEYRKLATKGEKVKEINIEKGISKTVEVVFKNDVGALIPKGQSASISQTISLSDSIPAPVAENETIGKVTYNIGENKLLEVDLVTKEEIKKIDMITMTCKIYEKWFNLLR